MIALRQRAVIRVDERDHFADQVVFVAPDPGGVDELRTAKARPHVRQHDDHRGQRAAGDQAVDLLLDVLAPRAPV